MTSQQIAQDIARGIAIRAEIDALKTELKQIEDRLKSVGEHSPQIPLQDPNREGKQYLAQGHRHILPIRFESDLLVASFDPDSTIAREIKEITGDLMPKFYAVSPKYSRVPKDGEALRKLARQLLTPEEFALLIRAATDRTKDGIAKSRTIVAWEDTRPLHPAASQSIP